jgi:hypothetical protein
MILLIYLDFDTNDYYTDYWIHITKSKKETSNIVIRLKIHFSLEMALIIVYLHWGIHLWSRKSEYVGNVSMLF